MKVTSVETFLVHPGRRGKNLLFVKVNTDDGIHGWGEAYTQSDRDRSIEVTIHELARYLEGRDPWAIKHFTHWAYNDFLGKRGSMECYSAISGLEHALWDICGKAAGQPVYNLLGGPCRDKIRVYANGWGDGGKDPHATAAKALELVEQGFTALKWDPFPNPWRAYIDKEQEQHAIDGVRIMRETVGPDIDLMVEVHRRLAPINAIRVANAIEEYRPYWFEEPVSARNLDAMAEVRKKINLPIMTGEELYTKTEFREVFERRSADILNPDVCNVGGILELKEIAAMAEAHLVAMSPHNYNSTMLGLAATVHASATMPNFLITEYFVNFEDLGKVIAKPPLLQEGGYVPLPKTPGLGIDLDEDALRAHAYERFPMRGIRQYRDEP
ncbi:MAG: mandelate racemase/muconate lactonizing enzyme family protein [Chloroflexi bacterium]|nr:mandelate racemase/muconate lactonizing enzyme family protein [Chloroflexota bacterium]